MKSYIVEIENKFAKYPVRTSKQNPEAYIGGGQSKLKYIGLRVPHLREVFKSGFSFSHHEQKQVAEAWNYVWKNSDCYEVMSLALAWYYQPKQKPFLKSAWPELKTWSVRIDNWAHADTLCGIYSRILEEDPKTVYPVLLEWNNSKNPWLRRMSLVSLIFYSSAREKYLPAQKILKLVQNRLTDEDYYVQKGVGWTLREAHNVYPKETMAFIEKHIRQLSAIAFSAATEKVSVKQKTFLKKLRKIK